MNVPVTYNSDREEIAHVAKEPPATFMKSFSSQEEAEQYRLETTLAMSDMEKFQKFCRLMRIGKMLTSGNTSSDNK